MNNIKEKDLYEPMRLWLQRYLEQKYRGYEVITVDSHNLRLDRVLDKLGIKDNNAVGIDIQIDILGVIRKESDFKIFFIEAKKTSLTLRDLGQLWAYCKLIDPHEAFLLTPKSFGSLDKILHILKREDLLDYGDNKLIKKMKLGLWNMELDEVRVETLYPKM